MARIEIWSKLRAEVLYLLLELDFTHKEKESSNFKYKNYKQK